MMNMGSWLALLNEMILEEKKVFVISMTKKAKSLVLVNGKKIEKSHFSAVVSFLTSLEEFGIRDILRTVIVNGEV